MKPHSLISDLLTALHVPHTADYSDARFAAMPFQSVFGLTKLLNEYGVATKGLQISDKSELSKLTPPFLADTPHGLVIIDKITPTDVTYTTQGEQESIPLQDFLNAWNGIVLLCFPSRDAHEPQYAEHHRIEIFNKLKNRVLAICLFALFAYLFIANRIYDSWSLIVITVFDLAGLALSYMLLQKTLKIKSATADKVCGILQEGGCDHVLETKASKLLGIFSWSEIGFTYFFVSMMALLMFPSTAPWLALVSACSVPFPFWSIWYQKYRAHHWCTLCVSVQALLILSFVIYLIGGWYAHLDPWHIGIIVLGVCYLTVLLILNNLMPLFKPKNPQTDETTSDTVARP